MATSGDVSDLNVLSYNGENMVPTISGFSRLRVSQITQTEVCGGPVVQRKNFHNTPYVCGASFYLEDEDQQDFIKTFFTENEGEYFICYLKADRPLLEPYVVQVISEWKDAYVSAVDGLLTVTLEIVSVRDDELDDFLFSYYQEIGSELGDWVSGFKSIVKAMPTGD